MQRNLFKDVASTNLHSFSVSKNGPFRLFRVFEILNVVISVFSSGARELQFYTVAAHAFKKIKIRRYIDIGVAENKFDYCKKSRFFVV